MIFNDHGTRKSKESNYFSDFLPSLTDFVNQLSDQRKKAIAFINTMYISTVDTYIYIIMYIYILVGTWWVSRGLYVFASIHEILRGRKSEEFLKILPSVWLVTCRRFDFGTKQFLCVPQIVNNKQTIQSFIPCPKFEPKTHCSTGQNTFKN